MLVIDFLKILLCLLPLFDRVAPFHLRLPTVLEPMKYHLHITTRIHQDILPYNGNVTIELNVVEPTDEIVLHAKYLHGFEVSLQDLRTGRQIEGLRYQHEDDWSLLRISSIIKPLNLRPGEQYRLEILFDGTHQGENFGFYKDTYLNDFGDVIPIAITQFEPTSARVAFPCFDEPHLKARFIISITHGSNYTALSNMPVDGTPIQSSDTQMTTTTFLKTPRMSTYLVAFAVTNYHHIREIVNGREHRVYFPPNSKDNGSHALKNGISSLTALENYFGIEYPLPKLDHIRVEKTYGIAMENWGLLIYNNKNFVTNVRNNSLEEIHKIVSQNHEIAHQWFGNLVSPKWWTYVWLKEGFAVYFSYIAAQLVFPEKNMDEYFISREMRGTFKHSYHQSMTLYVETELDIRRAYNVIAYRFGGCFVRMFHHAIGHKTFVKGVVLYLTRFQYSVADENDLFEALQEAVDEDKVSLFQNNKTAAIMRSWTHNIGIPTVIITRNFNNGTITIRQKPKNPSSIEKWWIPLSFATASSPNFQRTTADYIMPPQEEVTISFEDLNLNIKNTDWLIVDKQQIGLYHVEYDDQSMHLIAEALNKDHKQIHRFNRAKFLRDLADLEGKNVLSVDTLLDVIQYLQFEEDLLVWENAANVLLLFYDQLHGGQTQELFKSFMRDLVRDVFQNIYNSSKHDHLLSAYDTSFKDKILKIACEVDLSDCLHYTKQLTNDYFLNELSDEHLKSDFTLCQGLKTAAFDEFKKLARKVTSHDRSIVKFYEFLFSLKCVKSLENIRYFLEIISGEKSTDSPRGVYLGTQALSMLYLLNHEARPMIFEHLDEKDKQTAVAIRDGSINMERRIRNELSTRKTFQKNHEENISKWLEKNYARKELAQNS